MNAGGRVGGSDLVLRLRLAVEAPVDRQEQDAEGDTRNDHEPHVDDEALVQKAAADGLVAGRPVAGEDRLADCARPPEEPQSGVGEMRPEQPQRDRAYDQAQSHAQEWDKKAGNDAVHARAPRLSGPRTRPEGAKSYNRAKSRPRNGGPRRVGKRGWRQGARPRRCARCRLGADLI